MTSHDAETDWRFERARAYERAMYARLTRDGTELESYPATRPGAVLFVDLNVGDKGSERIEHVVTAIEQLRELSPAGLGNVSTVLFRWPELSVIPRAIEEHDLARVWEQISESLEKMKMAASAGLVCAPLGLPPSITWGPGSLAPADLWDSDGDAVGHNWKKWLLACREVELTALLQNGRGIWRPRHYHYRLPSGRHSATFVRLGDAVRSVRDADVLAWWLHEHAVENVGVVLDTSTIVPIILALRDAMATNDRRLGRIESLASYPATQLEFTSSVGRARRGEHSVLALLSVNSSGSVRDRLLDALRSTDKNDAVNSDTSDGMRPAWALHTFVDKMGDEAHHLDETRVGSDQQTSVWSSQGEHAEMVAERCELCNDPMQSRTVQIDPKSFDGLVLPDPVLVTPDIQVADAARVFWHLCDQTDALSLDDDPHPSVSPIRPHGRRMGVVIEFDNLLKREVSIKTSASSHQPDTDDSMKLYPIEELAGVVAERLDEQHRKSRKSARVSSSSAIDFIRSAELVVGLKDEFERADGGGKEFIDKVLASWDSQATIVGFSLTDQEHNQEMESSIRNADTVCVFVLGVVTGTSLHLVLAWIQEVRRASGPGRSDVGVFALHLRPASWRAREVIVNPFGNDRVVAAFESVFPDGPSPLETERRLLDSYAEVEQVNSLPYYGRRREYLRREAESSVYDEQPESVFWGLRPESEIARLRPGSLFGERLTATATLMAVGSGVQRQRHHDRALGEIPEWRQFEIPAIFGSYFDFMIVCSILRWLEKEECWWGREISRSDDVIQNLLKQYTNEAERAVVLGELLLAAAMGKVPKKAVEVIVDGSRGLIGEAEAAGNAGHGEVYVEALKLGLALLDPQNAPADQAEAEDAREGIDE